MVVKEKRGRRRYIAFRSDRRITDEQLLAALNAALSPRGVKVPKVIQFDGEKGILRCPLSDKEKVLTALASRPNASFHLVTISTSGTLRTLREKYFVAAER
jgi:RNase P/RNase MRP subunit POP5